MKARLAQVSNAIRLYDYIISFYTILYNIIQYNRREEEKQEAILKLKDLAKIASNKLDTLKKSYSKYLILYFIYLFL